ncbi:MAG: caspase family protein, partial [Myxococcota bacterium]
ERFTNVMIDLGAVDRSRTRLLRRPTHEALKDTYASLRGGLQEAKRRGEHVSLFFYFSGHGDGRDLHLKDERLPIKKVLTTLQQSPADTVVVIIDACRQRQGVVRRKGGAVIDKGFEWPVVDHAPAGFVYLTSAAEGEVAQESDDLQSSVFTYHLLSGLRGAADIDGDGVVNLDEMYRYGYHRTLEDTHRRALSVQHSEASVALSGRGSFAVTYPRRSGAILELGEDLAGDLLIVNDDTGRVVAERRNHGPRTVRLALPPSTYRILRRADHRTSSGLVKVSEGIHRVQHDDLIVQRPRAGTAKGSYDPRPYLLRIGTLTGPSVVPDIGLATGMALGAGYRVDERFRLFFTTSAAYASNDEGMWRANQIEWSTSFAFDAVFYDRWGAWSIGPRLGVLGVAQRNTRRLNIDVAEALGQPTSVDAHSVGPRLGLALAYSIPLSSRWGLRATIEPYVAWLSVDGQANVRWSAVASLGPTLRL